MPTTRYNWHEAPKVQRYLDALNPAELFIKEHLALIGEDYLRWTGYPVEHLTDLRRAAVEASYGPFRAATTREMAEAYLAADERFPSVQAVLNARFGNPNSYGRFAETANRCHRADPWQLVRAEVAA